MVWTTIPDGDVDPDSPLTTGLLTALRDNPVAIANGDTGAPQLQTAGIANAAVTQAKIAASAVGQGQLKTTTGQVSVTGSSSQLLVLPGGQYGLYPQIRNTSVGSTSEAYISYGNVSTSFTTHIYLANNISSTLYAQQRYVQASPPYDLGDGEIPLFIFAVVDNTTGSIESTYTAPEAPWHYNGPTDIRAQVYQNGKPCRFRRDMSTVPFTWEQAKGDPVKEAEYAAAFAAAPIIEEEITQAIKNADMDLIPHPFQGNDLTGKTVVMLDPVSDLTHQLFAMHSEYDDFDLASLLTEANALRIDNVPLTRSGPPGVQIVDYKWR